MNVKIDLLNEKMQTGYKYFIKNRAEECSRIWIETWSLIKEIVDENQIQSISDFDKTYKLTEMLYNWASDFQEVLKNTQNYKKCVKFCEWLIPLYKKGDLNLIVAKMTIAESYFDLNNKDMGEKSFLNLTEEHPQYAWGWINWSAQYWQFNNNKKDYKKGADILLNALNIKNIEDKIFIYERLCELYKESGEKEKAEAINKKINKTNSGNIQENTTDALGLYSESHQSDKSKKKIGRNDPCYCGSGKKYKKCCLSN